MADITSQNMLEYGFSLSPVFPYKDRFCSDMGKYRSEKIRTLAYFMQCMFVCGVHLSTKLDSSYIRHTIKLSAFIFECVSINICKN